MPLEGLERYQVERLTYLTVLASIRAVHGDVGGFAMRVTDTAFLHIATYEDSSKIIHTLFKLPQALHAQIQKAPVHLTFPETAWLPTSCQLSNAMLVSVGTDGKSIGLLWVGRRRGSQFAEEEQAAFLRFADGFNQLLTPLLPFITDGAVLRSWLEVSMQADATQWLERGLTFLLELLLFVSDSRDGAIVLMDKDGTHRFGVSCGDGSQFLNNTSDPSLSLNRHWLSKVITEPNWTGLMTVRAKPLHWRTAEQALEAIASVMRLLVLWSSNSSWLNTLVWQDPMTQLLNRRAFMFRLDSELNRAKRYRYPVSVLLADLDNFKPINDLLGHHVGDEVLRQVAQMLKRSVRRYDFVSRYGGDEFAIALPATPLEGALAVAERLRKRVLEMSLDELEAIRHQIGLTVGISVAQGDEQTDVKTLVSQADQAMLLAKAKGRNRIEVAFTGEVTDVPSQPQSFSRDLWSMLAQFLSHSLGDQTEDILGLTQSMSQMKGVPQPIRKVLEQIEKKTLSLRDFSSRITRMPLGELVQELENFQRRIQNEPSEPNTTLTKEA